MRSFSRSQLGSTNWAFIITLLLLLVFVWMWYDETDKHDKMASDLANAQKKAREVNDEAVEIAKQWEDLSKVVGWRTKNYSFKHVTAANPNVTVSNTETITLHATPEGVLAAQEGAPAQDGLLKQILDESTIVFERTARRHETTTGEESEHNFTTLSAAFKEKLNAVMSQLEEIKANRPVPPADPDDDEGKTRYEAAYADYMRKIKEYDAKLEELTSDPAYADYKVMIQAPGTWGTPSQVGVKVSMYAYADSGVRTLQAAFEGVPQAFRRFKQELAAYANKANELINQLEADKTAKEAAITQLQTQIAQEQEGRTQDVEQLQRQVQEANARANANGVRATKAENDLAKLRDESGKEIAGLNRDLEARKEQNRLLKEKRDLILARDDVDGHVLAVNRALRTATINRGTSEKVWVGQKFVVSSPDRAGNRVNRAEIMIVRVTGNHSAQVRINSGVVTAGDRIHNPFYVPGERVYVWFAGKMDKWPMQMARERLAKINVVVQDRMDGNTHYAVVPNSWAAAADAAPAGEDEDEGDDEGAASGSTPLEEVQKAARTFGANVITERLLDAFLDY